MSCSAVAAVVRPECSAPQQSAYGFPVPQGHVVGIALAFPPRRSLRGTRNLLTDFEVVQECLCGRGDGFHSLLEGLGVGLARRTEAADLADVLERCGADVLGGGVGHIGLAEGLDA